MSVLIASNLRKELSGDPLFDGVSFSVDRGQRLALAGQNGAGKTTLLRAIIGRDDDPGRRDRSPEGRAGRAPRPAAAARPRPHAPRVRPLGRRRPRRDRAGAAAARGGDGGRRRTTTRRCAATALRRRASSTPAAGTGATARPRSCAGSGFRDHDLDRQLNTFSGGELTRASLGRTLAGDPDLLLLDEPTNHLDVDSLEWLERELTSIDAAVVLVAHDRWFLESVTTAVLELEGGRGLYFAGPWHQWRLERAARATAAAKSVAARRRGHRAAGAIRGAIPLQEVEGEAGAGEDHADRPAREGAQEAAGELENLTRRRRGMGFDFLKPARTRPDRARDGRPALSAGGSSSSPGGTLVIERGEHVALVGPNGSGKTTLLETLVGHREPDAGVVRVGHGVEPAYFSQHDVELDERGTVLDCAVTMTGLPRPQAQNLLGKFLFSGYAEQEKPVSVLSGGERRRLSLAVVVASGANFLVLDEPTNHLDLEGREALEAALEAFPGALLLVSHDRALLDAVAERTVAIEERTLRSYDGGWADLVRAREEEAAPPAAPPEPVPRAAKPDRQPKPAKKQPTELEQVERRITTLEQHVTQLEAKLAEDWTNMDTLTEYRTSRDELQELLARWEVLFESA